MEKQVLSLEECEALVCAVRLSGRKHDWALILSLLFCGGKARTWTWGQAAQNFADFPQDVYYALREMAHFKKLNLSISPRDFSPKSSSNDLLERAIFSAAGKTTPLTTQDVTRRIKRYARRAGIKSPVNLRTLVNTYHLMRKQFGSAAQAADWLLHKQLLRSFETKSLSQRTGFFMPITQQKDPRLHGIGRRTR